MKLRFLSVLFLGALAPLAAKVTVAGLFTDHTVLQQAKPVIIWGTADVAEHVTVDFHGQSAGAEADEKGEWKAQLPAFAATDQGADLVIRGENTITLHDVVVGEVWLCSGQSNMEFALWNSEHPTFRAKNGAAEVAAAHYPQIRQFKVELNATKTPRSVVAGTWVPCSPATAGSFTAVGYFFARDLHRRLKIPVGIINSTYGGTPVEAWMSQPMLESDPRFVASGSRFDREAAGQAATAAQAKAKLRQWEADRKAAQASKTEPDFLAHHVRPVQPPTYPTGYPRRPAVLYNGMIAPLLAYQLRGVLWYQGEANGHDRGSTDLYHELFSAMITGWRAQFGQGDLPFYWVQLAGYDTGGAAWPYLREAQHQTLSLPNTGEAIAIDVGEKDNIHPRNKQEVGRRLALIAADHLYHIPGEFSGPVFVGAQAEGSAMRVRFDHVAQGLKADQPVAACELAGADHKFYPAEAKIDGNSLVVTSVSVPQPVAVRYSWAGFAEGHLYNSAGQPAGPFRSDHW